MTELTFQTMRNHIPARELYVGRYPPQPVFVLWTAPTLSLTLLMAHATSSQPLPISFLIPSSFYAHLPAYEDGTDRVFQNVGI
jgi:hypothetical protein